MHTYRYDEYVEGHEDDNIYKELIKVDQNLTVSDEVGLTELDIGAVIVSFFPFSSTLHHINSLLCFI
jgi:hypothetical protein